MAKTFERSVVKRRKGARWNVQWFDAERGQWRNKTAYTDRGASPEPGRKLERQAARRAEGVVDPMVEHRRRPSVRTIWRRIAEGKLPQPVYIGAAARLPETEVEAYIERLKRGRRQ